MPNYTKEQIMNAYRNLPEDVKEAMFSVDTVEIIREIGEKHKLMINKIGELANETGLVMLGLTHPNQFISNLTERLEVEHDIVKEIAEEINSRVFFPIRENLKKIHGVEEAAPEGGEPRPEISGREAPATIIPEIPAITPAPSAEKVGPPAGEAGAPTPPMAGPAGGPEVPPAEPPGLPAEVSAQAGIFEAKTKEEIFRSPVQIVENPEAPTVPSAPQKIDPYREQT